MMEPGQIKLGRVSWILKNNNITADKWFVRQQVLVVLGFDVQLLDGFITEYVSSCFDGSNMGACVEYLIKRLLFNFNIKPDSALFECFVFC